MKEFMNFFFADFWHFFGMFLVLAMFYHLVFDLTKIFVVARNERLGREAEIVRALESAYWLALSVKETAWLSGRIQAEAIITKGDIQFVLPKDRVDRILERRRQFFNHDEPGVDKPSPEQ
jgi:hypothetical protein